MASGPDRAALRSVLTACLLAGAAMALPEAPRMEAIADESVIGRGQSREVMLAPGERISRIECEINALGSIFTGLDRLDLEGGKPLVSILSERLDQVAARIEGEAIEDPLALARMRRVLGESQLGLGYHEKAVGLLTRCRDGLLAKPGPMYPNALDTMDDLAHVIQNEAARPDLALPLYERMLMTKRATLSPGDSDTLATMNDLAGVYLQLARPELAIPLLEEVLDLVKAKRGLDHPDTLVCMNNLAWACHVSGKLDRAVILSREAIGYWRQKDAGSPLCGDALASLGLSLVRANRWADAEPILRECLAIREARRPDDWKTFLARSALGEALLGQGKLTEAGPLLLDGYEGMRRRSGKITGFSRSYVPEAVDRLIKLADAAGRPEEAKLWRDEKIKLLNPPSSKPKTGRP